MRLYERVLRAHAGASAGVCALFGVVLVIAGSYFCYSALGSDLLPEHGRRRIHCGLSHAGGLLAGGHQPRGGATWSRSCSDTPEVESTSRRTGLQLGLAAVTEANRGDISVKLKRKRNRSVGGSDRRCAREGHEAGADAGCGVPAVAAGHDRRSHQRAGADRDQAVFAGSRCAAASGRRKVADAIKKIPGVVDVLNGIDNTISGPAVDVSGRSGGGGARRFHAAGSGTGRQRDSAGRAGAHAGGGERPRVHHPRAISGADARFAGSHPEHAAGELDREDGDAGIAGQPTEEPGPDGNPARESAARCGGDGAAGGAQSGRGHGGGAEGGGNG